VNSLWTWLNTPPGVAAVLDPFGLVFATVFGAGFLASAYLAGPGGNDLAHHDPQAQAIHHWANVGLWIFGPGLFFFAMRALQINPLSFGEPIWLVASIIALIVAAIRFAAWWRMARPVRAEPSKALLSRVPRAGCPPGGGVGG
jgi:hypothetical protein